jgi:hypothetical protein
VIAIGRDPHESIRKQILASAEGLILSPDDIVIFN